MNTHTPDKWLVIKVEGFEGNYHYRVFGSWYGGWTGSDSWRMNSGITSVTEDRHYYYFKGHSGSIYACHKDNYGAHGYGTRVLEDFLSKGCMEIVADSTDFLNLDYKDTYGKSSN